MKTASATLASFVFATPLLAQTAAPVAEPAKAANVWELLMSGGWTAAAANADAPATLAMMTLRASRIFMFGSWSQALPAKHLEVKLPLRPGAAAREEAWWIAPRTDGRPTNFL